MARTPSLNPRLCLLWALVALAAWRWWVGAALPLSVDEAYYYAWSLTPDWGYWTKPPLIAWAIGAADAVCGPSAGCLRSVGVLGFTACAVVMHALLVRMGLEAAMAAATALGFATLPLASFYGMAATTDALLLLCWLLAMLSLWHALHEHPWGWIALGLSAGLGLLAKYSMGVLAPSVALVLLHPAWRHHWRRPGPYLAAAIAGVVFAPNLWWNLTHGMPTLQHTAEISKGASYGWHPQVMLGFLAEQWLVGNVVLVTVFAVWVLRGRWRGSPLGWFWLMLSAPMLVVIALQALLSRANANWAAPAHVAMCVVGVTCLWQGRRRAWLIVALAFNLLFAVLLYHGQTLVREPLGLSASWRTDPYWALRNWPGLHEQARARLSEQLPPASWRIASDDRAVLAQLQWALQLPAGSAMGWSRAAIPMNHFEQRFALHTGAGPILLLTQASEDEVRRQFPHARATQPLRSAQVQSEAIQYGAWWLD